MDGHFMLELIGLCFTVVAAIWIYEQSIRSRFQKIWERVDEKQKMYFETFVKKELYENDQKHLKERTDDRFTHVMEFVKSTYENLTKSIEELKKDLKESGNHQKNH